MQEQIDFPLHTAVKVKWRKMPFFTYPWHFHREIEILYIMEGSGNSFVADHIEAFGPGDLTMMGSNLPHFWRSDPKYHTNSAFGKMHYIVIQFPGDLFNDSLFQYPEFHILQELFLRSSQGIRFFKPFARKVHNQIIRMAKSSGFERIVRLLQLLHELAQTDQYRLLAGELYQKNQEHLADVRLTKVLHYLTTNYQRRIDLETVSEIAHLHPSAFCRYFREKTGKTLSAYLNDMRISYACKLILEGQLNVSQICFECGFNNISNFNRAFKKYTGLTPTDYFRHFHTPGTKRTNHLSVKHFS